MIRGTTRALLLMLLLAAPAQAAALYEARAITTGMDQRARPQALARCLAQVLAKVAGNPALETDPRVAALGPAAPAFLASIAYLDRMSDQPKRDEQGTRDRPYDLIARFEPARIDAALTALGEAPWPEAARPALLADIAITPRTGPTMPLRADTDADERHRAALLAAADRAGLALLLRPVDGPLPSAPLTLRGSMAWQDGAGWAGNWTLLWQGRDHTWGIAGVSFDDAYRSATSGAASILSGHGTP